VFPMRLASDERVIDFRVPNLCSTQHFHAEFRMVSEMPHGFRQILMFELGTHKFSMGMTVSLKPNSAVACDGCPWEYALGSMPNVIGNTPNAIRKTPSAS
jgi:hypothetical protein